MIDKTPMNMLVTSVCGHIIEYHFPKSCKDWKHTKYKKLYKTGLEKAPAEKNRDIVKNLHTYGA